MQGHTVCQVKPALFRLDPSKFLAGLVVTAAFPEGGGFVIFIFFPRGNPVKYTDPDGRWVDYNSETGLTSGWGHYGFQRIFGYFNFYDALSYALGFSIHGTRLNLGDTTLRLWKGNYGLFGAGAEIGLYNNQGKSLNRNELAERGIESTTLEIYHVKDGLIASRTEGGKGKEGVTKKPSFWTTAFTPFRFRMKKNLFTVNTITFPDEEAANTFASGLGAAINEEGSGTDYFKNNGELINYSVDGRKVIIYHGGKQDE
jgi:hypothetical protein